MAFKVFRKKGVVGDNDQKSRGGTGRILSLFGRKQSTSKQVKKALGGTYISRKDASLRSLSTQDATETPDCWQSCASRDYKQRSKLSFEDQQKEWGQAIVDARRLPRTAHFASNHIMINRERTKRTIPALKRSSELDAVARWHAEAMAAEGKVRHSDPKELQMKLQDPSYTYLGENVAVGESIKTMHLEMVETVGDLRNMCDRRYQEMGMATARCPTSGKIYLAQIFRGQNNKQVPHEDDEVSL